MNRARAGFLAGALAGVAMVVAALALRLTTSVISLPEVLAEWAITVMPPQVFAVILDSLEFAAKPTLFAVLALGEVLVGGLLGRYWAGRGARVASAALLVGVVWVMTVVAALPLFGFGLFGAGLADGAAAVSGSILATYAAYGAALVWVYRRLVHLDAAGGREAGQEDPQRRLVLQRLGLGLAALVVGGAGWRALAGFGSAGAAMGSAAPGPSGPDNAAGLATSSAEATLTGDPFQVPGLSPEITPTSEFYRVSKNLFDPSVDGAMWRLEIAGQVEQPRTLRYDDLKALPAVENFYTLECISNEVGGDLMGNAHWRGVRLRDLLTQAGVKEGVVDVVFHAADGYADSIPVELGLHPDTLLAYGMNGQPLTNEHGFPARVLVPGIFGMKNAKWVTKIELVSRDFQGFWQERGWSDVATYQTTSRFDTPSHGSHVPAAPRRLAGVAFAGDRGIAKVEVSADGGASWAEAELKPALSPYTWRLWSYAWTPNQAHGYSLRVRAVDGQGNVQTDKVRPTLPDGATGYHRITVNVA